ncbi:hypothetical protein ACFL4O_02555, partial [bacterium]
MDENKNNSSNEKGIVLVMVIIFILAAGILSTATTVLVRDGAVQTFKARKHDETFHIAEAGIQKAIQQVIKYGEAYTGETDTAISSGNFDIAVSTVAERVYEIVATGNVPKSGGSGFSKKVKSIFRVGTKKQQDEIFYYAVIAGNDITISNYAVIGDYGSYGRGSVRANGNILCSNYVTVRGNATASGTVILNYFSVVNGNINQGADPVVIPTLDMDYYRTQAQEGGTITTDVTYTTGTHYLGPKYINGVLEVKGDAVLYLTGPVYVKDQIKGRETGKIYGGNILISEDQISFTNNSKIGKAGDLMAVISSHTDFDTIYVSNLSGYSECVFFAPYGGIIVDDNVRITGALVGNNVVVTHSADVKLPEYEINMDLPGSIDVTANDG